jgi:hypothetical protein
MKIDKRNYHDIAFVLNCGISYLLENDFEDTRKQDRIAISKAQKLVSKLGLKPITQSAI